MFRLALSLGIAIAVVGCGDDASTPPPDAGGVEDAPVEVDAAVPDWPGATLPASMVVAPGVRRDVFEVPGFSPAPNPTTGASTPPALNATRVLRYRRDEDPAVEARAVLVAMPGFLGGGASYHGLAIALVTRGLGGEPIEVWAIDRRSNLLEDMRGMDAAEAAGDPEIAQGYYFRQHTVDGEAFEGFAPAGTVSYMSEWGLQTHVEDLHAVIGLVPEAERRPHVFLIGHSLGAAFSEIYASWRFEDGTRGAEELAGVVLLDGALGDVAIDEAGYQQGTMGGLMSLPGVVGIRETSPYFALPVLGVAIYARLEVQAMRALLAPDAVVEDRQRDQALSLLLSLSPGDVPPFTNRAGLAVGFDDDSAALSFAGTRLGELTGGPVEEYDNELFGGRIVRPSDPTATYGWTDAFDASPADITPVDTFAHATADGSVNFAEWYFPSRLTLDIQAAAGTDVPEGDFREDNGIRAFDRELIDAPYLAIAAALVGAGGYDTLATRMGPTVGPDRPNAGATRSEELGLRIVDATELAHLDPVLGVEGPDNPVPFEIERFVGEHVGPGTIGVVVP